ncbi:MULTISPECIES: acyl-CoA dehydrogenase family protein [unclassified Minwuia]|jgi:alkylation response protein AidB-like acyl-CoA dehydrogenase|uniref:acyl-CoA dehydrogenase family protein n=1 Tax=unclassified Minwuia TaxID=2618799 RepID=UPI00247929BB|nr:MULTISPECIES: acyl-CoA dehydrogenase family protein [unclassified Minwuia]
MDLAFSPDEQAFRAEVRTFLEAELPDDLRHKVRQRQELEREDYLRWQRILHARGWIAGSWPKEYGGCDWTPAQRHIFDEECHAADAPPLLPFGLQMVGPVIFTFGRPDQKEFFLPRLLSGEHWWCQGYSEPGSGSDLASLQTAAVRDGDDYIINGQKIWTSLAHHADWIFCLVRTRKEGKHQEGISFLLIDMKTPGITVRPLILMDQGHHVNEVFFENVRVPVANRIGEENRGWTYAKFLLGNERAGIAEVAWNKKLLQRLKEMAADTPASGDRLLDDAVFSRKVAETEVKLTALEYCNLRILAAMQEGSPPGGEASMLKLLGSEVTQAITELTVEALGYYAAPYELADRTPGSNWSPVGPEAAEGVMGQHLFMRAITIAGGSSEVQKNIIAKMVLGL